MEKPFFSLVYITYGIWIFLLCMLCLSMDKGTMVVYLNGAHTSTFDLFFKWITVLGHGLWIIPLLLFSLFLSFRSGVFVALVGLTHGLFCALFKKVLFSGTPRPVAFFENKELLHFVEGVSVHHYNSFPSGHTATAFALAMAFTYILGKKSWIIPLSIIALLVGISRVYLLQHFMMDVLAGSILGVFSCLLSWQITQSLPDSKYPWMAFNLQGTAFRGLKISRQESRSISRTSSDSK